MSERLRIFTIVLLAQICRASGSLDSILLPAFQENAGQAPSAVRFLASAHGYAAAFDLEGPALYVGTGPDQKRVPMQLRDRADAPILAGDGNPDGITAVYADNRNASRHRYRAIRYRTVYPGIDWVWHFRGNNLESQFELAAGADSQLIRIAFACDSRMSLDPEGNLELQADDGLYFSHPQAWQMKAGQRLSVSVSFRIDAGVVAFDVGPHDSQLPLIIGPVLIYARFIGGAGNDAVWAVATDAGGNTYVTGETSSLSFSASTVTYNKHAFVSKISPDGTRILYNLILASTGSDVGNAIAVDTSGNAWVGGSVGGSGFPATTGAWSNRSLGGTDGFLAKISGTGQLIYCTYLGGSGTDIITGVALDSRGNVYASGYTSSVDFPTVSGAPQRTLLGGNDAFVAKLAGGVTLVYATLLGGVGNDTANALSIDSTGIACIAGQTTSPGLPVVNALQQVYVNNGNQVGLFGCLNAAGTAWTVLTYLGGNGPAGLNAIARDSSQNIYLAGSLYSANQSSPARYGAYVLKLNSAGTAVSFTAFLAGSANSAATAIAVDSTGDIWLAGYAASADFPVTTAPAFRGYFDGFVSELDPSGSSVLFSRFLGGAGDDRCTGIAVNTDGTTIVVGVTGSADFPTTTGTPSAPSNGFVARFLAFDSPPRAVSVAPSSGSGTNQTFQFVYSKESGASNLTAILALVNSTLAAPGSCYMQIDPSHSYLWLLNDQATALLGPITLGTSASVTNSQCRVNGSGSGVVSAGVVLTVNLSVSFMSPFSGAKNLYTNALDAGGLASGWTVLGTWNVPAPLAPQPISVTPSSGTGSSQTFAFQYFDSTGASGLTTALVLINPSLSTATGTCYLEIDPAHANLWLLNDAGNGVIGPIVLGTAATVQNSQCIVSGNASSVSIAGTAVTINLSLTFMPSFAGAKNVYANAIGPSGASAGWAVLGTWTIPQLLAALSVAPSTGSGSAQTFAFVYSDSAGASDLSAALVLINRTLSAAAGCYLQIDPAHGYAWLLSDNADAALGPVVLGTPATLQNSQCVLNAAGSTIVLAGNVVTAHVSLTFRPAFAGAHNVYANAISFTTSAAGWRSLGTWVSP